MTLSRNTVFDCQGVAVRMVGRRDSGRVMVEYLVPRSHAPTGTWRECWPHELRAPGIGIGHIKSLALVLPLVRLAFDDAKTIDLTEAGAAADPGPEPEPWWKKL